MLASHFFYSREIAFSHSHASFGGCSCRAIFRYCLVICDQIFAMARGEIVYTSPNAGLDKPRMCQSVGV